MNTMLAFREKDRRNIRVFHGYTREPVIADTSPLPLYEFDEGDKISLDEGTHGVLVIGGVGRGKTASFMLPMAASLIDSGLPGLIIDVKNNFTDQVRKLAKVAGRENDIIEIGTHPTATPTNLLAGLSLDELQQVIESLLLSGQEHSANINWLLQGVRLLADMAMLLHYAGRIDECFAPSFTLLDRCINDFGFARTIFKMFLETGYDPSDFKQKSYADRVQATTFHILTDKKCMPKREYAEQMGYQLYGPRTIISAVTSDESLCTNLSAPESGFQLDYRQSLKENKIIVLRFRNTQGHAARILARHIKEKYYADIYRTLDGDFEMPGQCFFMADEFQDVINVSPDNAFDDFSWFSKAREFGCINVVATQALSSLYTNNLLRHQVDALVANCSTKIVLQNDDPAADQYFRHFCGLEKTLAQLGSSEALVSKFDLRDRKQVVNTLHCNREYERIQSRLTMAGDLARQPLKNESPTTLMQRLDEVLFEFSLPWTIKQRPDFMELVRQFKGILCATDKLEIEYDQSRHREIMTALNELNDRYQGKIDVKGIIEINTGGIYLDIEADDDIEDNMDDFVQQLLEGGHDQSAIS